MSDTTSSIFVRQDLVPERPAPVKTTGFVGFLRTRLFNSPTNILISIVSALLLWFILVPALKFALVDAVWTGTGRTACLAENVGRPVGACWPFIHAKIYQFIYGFYPEPERWRVNLTFILAAILLVPLLIPRLPAKGPNAILFFLGLPVVAFFLLRGGGLGGLGVSWTAALLSGFNDSIGDGGRKLMASGETTAIIGPLLWVPRQVHRADQHGDWLGAAAANLAARLYPGVQPSGLDRPPGDHRDRVRPAVLVHRRPAFRGASADHLPFDLCRHRSRDRRAGSRPRRTSGGGYKALGWSSRHPGGVRCWYRRLDAGRHRAGARPALDHSADPDFLHCLHRVLARGSADYRAVLCDLHAAVVRTGRFHHRRIDARADRHRAVRRRLSGRSDPRRPCGGPARAGRGRRARSACPGARPRR